MLEGVCAGLGILDVITAGVVVLVLAASLVLEVPTDCGAMVVVSGIDAELVVDMTGPSVRRLSEEVRDMARFSVRVGLLSKETKVSAEVGLVVMSLSDGVIIAMALSDVMPVSDDVTKLSEGEGIIWIITDVVGKTLRVVDTVILVEEIS